MKLYSASILRIAKLCSYAVPADPRHLTLSTRDMNPESSSIKLNVLQGKACCCAPSYTKAASAWLVHALKVFA